MEKNTKNRQRQHLSLKLSWKQLEMKSHNVQAIHFLSVEKEKREVH